MRQVTGSDMTAYRHLFERYAPAVKGLAFKMLRDEAVAEEIVQETFWRVWNSAHQFDLAKGSVPNWLFGIARNLTIDVLRKGRHAVEQALPMTDDEQAAHGELFQADVDVPEAAWSAMKHDQVRVAMQSLPEDQRNVIVWIYFQGMTRRQIAEVYDIPFGTINMRAKLALDKLRRALQAAGFED